MKTELEIQKENVKILLELIKGNPELRVVPMVDSEIVANDGYSSWLGSFGKAEVDYIWQNDERIYFKSKDEDELIEEQAIKRVKNYEWEKVIVIRIGLP